MRARVEAVDLAGLVRELFGALERGGKRAAAVGDYEAWDPSEG